MALQFKASPRLPAAAERRQRVLPAQGRAPLRVFASASPSGPTPRDPTVGPAGTPAGSTTPPVYIRSSTTPSGPGGAGGALGGSGGVGGSGNRPVGSGGSGSSGTPGGSGGLRWDRILLTLLGISLAVPAWNYLNRRYFLKPEPEHTLTKVEDKAAEIKQKNAAQKAASAVKHATVDPIKHAADSVKHSDAARAVQHKVEDAKDAVDVALHSGHAKAERSVDHGKKNVGQTGDDVKLKGKHAVEDTKNKGKHAGQDAKSKVEDVVSGADVKAHEANVKAKRGSQRAKEKISDAAFEAEEASSKAGKGAWDNIKGAASSVGRKLHLAGESTERAAKKHAHKIAGELEADVDDSATRRNIYYAAGGVALGTGLLAALYFYDKKGGDLKGKVRKLQERTKDAADQAMGKVKDATGTARTNINQATGESGIKV